MNILITSAGKRVSLVKAFQKELHLLVPTGKVIATDANPNYSAACMIADSCFKVPFLSASNYLEVLLEKCIKNSIKLIIPTIDTELELLAANAPLFLENGIQVVISSTNFISKCRDKRKIHEFFVRKGVEVAEEYEKNDLKFPLFIKPTDGSRSVDTFLIENKEDLTEYHFQNPKFMFLEYIDHSKNDEFTCDLYYDKRHQLKCVVPRKRIEVRDGEINKGITKNNILVTYIKKRLQSIEGARGCITAQFFLDRTTDRVVAIEINPRFGGGYPLSYLAGANFPKWLIQEYVLNEEIDFCNNWKQNMLMLRYDNEVIVENYVE